MSTNDNYVKTTLTVVGLGFAKMHMQGFRRWLRDYVETCSNNAIITDEIRNLAGGPLFTITIYLALDINGYTFYTMA
jgi:hypothetical protein